MSPLAFHDAVLRGIAQVMLQEKRVVGAVFLLGIACHSPSHALAAWLGAIMATALAIALRLDRAPIENGLFGFNGALVSVALLVFLQGSALTWGMALLAAALSSVVTAGFMRGAERLALPALTAPFVVVSWCLFLATAQFGRLHPSGTLPAALLPQATDVEGVVTLLSIVEGTLSGIGQVFFQESVLSGGLFLLALLMGSLRAGTWALAGSLIGALMAWWLGATEQSIHAGIHGFNGALVGIALGAVFFSKNTKGLVLTLLACICVPLVAAAVFAGARTLGLPGLTLPFVLVTWVFLWAGAWIPDLMPVKAPASGDH